VREVKKRDSIKLLEQRRREDARSAVAGLWIDRRRASRGVAEVVVGVLSKQEGVAVRGLARGDVSQEISETI
jgi:hypothetical protein